MMFCFVKMFLVMSLIHLSVMTMAGGGGNMRIMTDGQSIIIMDLKRRESYSELTLKPLDRGMSIDRAVGNIFFT